MNSRFKKIAGILATLLVLCGLYTLFPLSTTTALPLGKQHPDTVINNSSNAIDSQQNFSSLPDFTGIVERASPAVVSIMVSGLKNASNRHCRPGWTRTVRSLNSSTSSDFRVMVVMAMVWKPLHWKDRDPVS